MMWTGCPWEWGEWDIREMSRRKWRQQHNVNNETCKAPSWKKSLDYHSNKSQERGMGSISIPLKDWCCWREVNVWDELCRGLFWDPLPRSLESVPLAADAFQEMHKCPFWHPLLFFGRAWTLHKQRLLPGRVLSMPVLRNDLSYLIQDWSQNRPSQHVVSMFKQ